MWLEEIGIENIKCFAKQHIRLGTASQMYPWITFLGENGTGKSTVLQAIALLIAGSEGASQLLKPIGWVQEEQLPGKLSIRLHQGENDPGVYESDKKVRRAFQYTFYVTGEEKQSINNQLFAEPLIVPDSKNKGLGWLRQHAHLAKGEGWFGVGYGAFRRLTRRNRILVPSLQSPLRYTNFMSQFVEDEPLEAFETWLVYLDYRISKTNEEQAKRQKEWGIYAINQVLPQGSAFDSIDANGRIWFNTGGRKASTVGLSDGFRSVLALVGDLVWRLIETFPNSSNPLHEQGVVLIDELDIHLHPTWQREIAGWLRTTFPNLQFITATHSPLVAAGAGADAITYRFFREEGASVLVEPIKDIYTKNVDTILQTKAFGLVSAYSPDTQKKLDIYNSLKQQDALSATQKSELETAMPIVEKALGYGSATTALELRMNEFIKNQLE